MMLLHDSPKSRKKKGFTLIELLVVIAIIALLLSILMPALNAVKEQARTIVCASNLKQWNIIMGFFAADNRDQFPDADHDNGSHKDSDGLWWIMPILPYVENENILICAKAKTRQESVVGFRYIPQEKDDEAWATQQQCNCNGANLEMVWSSYGPNAWLMQPLEDGCNCIRRWDNINLALVPPSSFWGKMDRISTPSNVPFYLDSRWVDAWPHDNNVPRATPTTGGSGYMNHFVMTRHGKSVNAVFFDGSGRRIDIKDLWKLKWHKTFNTNGPWTQPDADWPGWLN